MRRQWYTVYLEGKDLRGLYTIFLYQRFDRYKIFPTKQDIFLEEARVDTLEGCHQRVREWCATCGIKRVNEWIRL